MPSIPLSYASLTLGRISIEVDQVRGAESSAHPQIIVPLQLDLAPPPANDDGQHRWFSVIDLACHLELAHVSIAESVRDPFDHTGYPRSGPSSHMVHFPIDTRRLAHIEASRGKSASFNFRGTAVVVEHPPATAVELERPLAHNDVQRLLAVPFSLQLDIPASVWIERVLIPSGYGESLWIELPLSDGSEWGEDFRVAAREIAEAKAAHLRGDFDNVVRHCRTAIEPFRRRAQSLKAEVIAARAKEGMGNKEFAWVRDLSVETATWLDKVCDQTWKLASESHHPPSIGHFNRTEAQSILMVTIGMCSYVSRIVAKRQDT